MSCKTWLIVRDTEVPYFKGITEEAAECWVHSPKEAGLFESEWDALLTANCLRENGAVGARVVRAESQ
jgi:hypothetical protein